MTDAKPVALYGYCPVCGQPGISRERRLDGDDRCASGHTYPSRLSVGEPKREPDAKPDVGALVARAIEYHAKMHKINSEICGKFWDVGAAAEAQEHADFHQALLALQAEVARLTQERDAYLVELRGPVKNGAVQKLGKALTRILDSDAWNGIEPLLNSAQAERDRLTQENERLAGEVAALRKPHQDPLGDALNSGDGVYRP